MGGKFDLYIPKEVPDWMSIRCTSENKDSCTNFEIKYCCPSTFDNDEELEKADRPFPIFNEEKEGKCSEGAIQYENGAFIDIKGSLIRNVSIFDSYLR